MPVRLRYRRLRPWRRDYTARHQKHVPKTKEARMMSMLEEIGTKYEAIQGPPRPISRPHAMGALVKLLTELKVQSGVRIHTGDRDSHFKLQRFIIAQSPIIKKTIEDFRVVTRSIREGDVYYLEVTRMA